MSERMIHHDVRNDRRRGDPTAPARGRVVLNALFFLLVPLAHAESSAMLESLRVPGDAVRWGPVIGNWDMAELPEAFTFLGGEGDNELGFAVASTSFWCGTLTLELVQENAPMRALVALGYNPLSGHYVMAGYDPEHGLVVGRSGHDGKQYRREILAKREMKLIEGRRYILEIHLSDAGTIVMLINDIQFLEHLFEAPLQGGHVGVIASGAGNLAIRNLRIRAESFEFNRAAIERSFR